MSSAQGASSGQMWTWDIVPSDGRLDCVVWHPDGAEVGRETRTGWGWSGAYPDAVVDIMPDTIEALIAVQRGDIARRGDSTDGDEGGGG